MHVMISCGDINGIATDIFFRTFKKHVFPDMQFSIAIHEDTARDLCAKWNINYVDLNMHFESVKITILPCNQYAEYNPGSSHSDASKLAIESLNVGLNAVKNGYADALLTLPISKEALNAEGWKYSGQTDWLKHEFEHSNPIMILFHQTMRVALTTVHIPLKNVAQSISIDALMNVIHGVNHSMKNDFNIVSPRIAILGLNPHSGEQGLLGDEEQKYIIPAIEKSKLNEIQCFGPFPADGFFSRPTWRDYDAIIAQYHDQGLIPLKFHAQGHGVNFTANLPIVRVSPDHGTAYDIAGTDLVEEHSMISAIESIRTIVNNRKSQRD
jgi:4-hydroxythreonine-4-phosphate dehydrogenase